MACRVQANRFSECDLSPLEAAYLAGLFDGEGSVYLAARKMKGAKSHHFNPEMTLGSTSLELLQGLVEMTGNGAIYEVTHAGTNHKTVYRWQLQPTQIRLVLPQILPYLRLKQRQGGLLLEYFQLQRQADRGPWGKADPAVIERILALYAELRSLNQRGLVKAEPLEFEIREGKARKRTCDHEDCENRRYGGASLCYKHWLTGRERLAKTCEECGTAFEAILPRARFCTPKCQWQNGARRRKNQQS